MFKKMIIPTFLFVFLSGFCKTLLADDWDDKSYYGTMNVQIVNYTHAPLTFSVDKLVGDGFPLIIGSNPIEKDLGSLGLITATTTSAGKAEGIITIKDSLFNSCQVKYSYVLMKVHNQDTHLIMQPKQTGKLVCLFQENDVNPARIIVIN
jgi:hypothetical protein